MIAAVVGGGREIEPAGGEREIAGGKFSLLLCPAFSPLTPYHYIYIISYILTQ